MTKDELLSSSSHVGCRRSLCRRCIVSVSMSKALTGRLSIPFRSHNQMEAAPGWSQRTRRDETVCVSTAAVNCDTEKVAGGMGGEKLNSYQAFLFFFFSVQGGVSNILPPPHILSRDISSPYTFIYMCSPTWGLGMPLSDSILRRISFSFIRDTTIVS